MRTGYTGGHHAKSIDLVLATHQMNQRTPKETIYIMPPAYHFQRAAMFAVASHAFENMGRQAESLKMKTDSVYEVALGFEAMVYQSSVPRA
jgi:hypothetical protein